MNPPTTEFDPPSSHAAFAYHFIVHLAVVKTLTVLNEQIFFIFLSFNLLSVRYALRRKKKVQKLSLERHFEKASYLPPEGGY